MELLSWHHLSTACRRKLFGQFVHCYAHRVNLVLSQGAKCIPEARICPERMMFLQEIDLPRSPTHWNSSLRIVSTVPNNSETFVMHLRGCLSLRTKRTPLMEQLLGTFEFIFMLLLYNQVLFETDVVFHISQQKVTDVIFSKKRKYSLLSFIAEKKALHYYSSQMGFSA